MRSHEYNRQQRGVHQRGSPSRRPTRRRFVWLTFCAGLGCVDGRMQRIYVSLESPPISLALQTSLQICKSQASGCKCTSMRANPKNRRGAPKVDVGCCRAPGYGRPSLASSREAYRSARPSSTPPPLTAAASSQLNRATWFAREL